MEFFQNTVEEQALAGASKAYILPIADLVTPIPEPPATGVAAGDTAEATGPYVFKAGKFAIDMLNNLYDGAQATEKQTGHVASPGQDSVAIFSKAGNSTATHELRQKLAGQKVIVLVQDADCASNQFNVVGCPCFPAYATKRDFDTGTVGGSNLNGTNYEFTSRRALYKITLTPSEIATMLAPAVAP